MEEVTQMRELFQEALGAGAQAPGVTREPEDKSRLNRIGLWGRVNWKTPDVKAETDFSVLEATTKGKVLSKIC